MYQSLEVWLGCAEVLPARVTRGARPLPAPGAPEPAGRGAEPLSLSSCFAHSQYTKTHPAARVRGSDACGAGANFPPAARRRKNAPGAEAARPPGGSAPPPSPAAGGQRLQPHGGAGGGRREPGDRRWGPGAAAAAVAAAGARAPRGPWSPGPRARMPPPVPGPAAVHGPGAVTAAAASGCPARAPRWLRASQLHLRHPPAS